MAINIDVRGFSFALKHKSWSGGAASRAQADKKDYQFELKFVCEQQEHLDLNRV